MNHFKNKSNDNINSILTLIKFAALLFGVIIVSYEIIGKRGPTVGTGSAESIAVIYGIFIPLLLIIYLLWSYLHTKMRHARFSKNIIIIENFIFIVLFSTLIILSESYSSQFKLLFLFVTISSVIQLGAKFGLTVSLISSLIIMFVDLFFAHVTDIKVLFQNDLILVSALILAAWSLGRYVDLQKENMNKKDAELQLLSTKLTEQELQRKYVEDMILKNEACYNLLITNSNNAIFIHRNTQLIFSNESAARLTGIDLTDLSDKSILDLVPSSEKEDVEKKYRHIYENRINTISFEQKLIGVNGIEAIVQNTSTCFVYEGKPTILTILHDITSEKQVEALQKDVQKNIELLNETREFNKLITEFFSNISHELKTPLNIIFSSVQLLDSYKGIDEIKLTQNKDKYLKIMKQNCYRLMRLINNLLDIARADSGFLTPHIKNCNIVSIVEDITMSVASFAESKGLSLIFDTDCEEKITAIDPDKIERIILNLLSNAIKFTNYGGQIFVDLLDKEDHIVISIKDNGIGIPVDKLQLIFERFRQIDRTFTRNHEGSGIGLSLVKSFVEMHEGTVSVYSELGEGSEFIIKLPYKLCSENYSDENYADSSIIERISIEFSDIYS
jgi:PAS domain S-box-containing protein